MSMLVSTYGGTPGRMWYLPPGAFRNRRRARLPMRRACTSLRAFDREVRTVFCTGVT